MTKAKALTRTAALILAGALIASGVSSSFASDAGFQDMARKGVADLIVEQVFLKG